MFECLKVNAMPPPPPAGKCYVMPFPVKVSRPRCPAPLAHPPALSTVCALRRGMVCWPSPLTPRLLARYGLPPMCVEGQTPDSPQHRTHLLMSERSNSRPAPPRANAPVASTPNRSRAAAAPRTRARTRHVSWPAATVYVRSRAAAVLGSPLDCAAPLL